MLNSKRQGSAPTSMEFGHHTTGIYATRSARRTSHEELRTLMCGVGMLTSEKQVSTKVRGVVRIPLELALRGQHAELSGQITGDDS